MRKRNNVIIFSIYSVFSILNSDFFKTMNPVIHFQMPADDTKRMSAFYTKVFGWQTKDTGPDMGGYVTATTVESDEKTGRPTKPGAINGGFFQKMDDPNSHLPNVVIAVDDINEHVSRVKKAGGKVTDKPTMIPNVGMFVMFTDTEGNRVCMLQPVEM